MKIKNNVLLKKAIAVALGITMALGALMLPDGIVKDELATAFAYQYITVDGNEYKYEFEPCFDSQILYISKIKSDSETIEIPSTLNIDGVDYPVSRISHFFTIEDPNLKTIIFPDTIDWIGNSILRDTSVENIVLPDGLEYLGDFFAAYCPNLKSVKYEGTNLKYLGWGTFYGSNEEGLKNSGILDDDGVVTLNNWLLRLPVGGKQTDIKISDYGKNGMKIEGIATYGVSKYKQLKSADLKDVKYICSNAFYECTALENVTNYDDVISVSGTAFISSPWFENLKKNDTAFIGKTLVHYKTDSEILEMDKGELAQARYVCEGALTDCKNLETILCNSDCDFEIGCFFKDNPYDEEHKYDIMPDPSVYKIKNVYLNGKKLSYHSFIEDKEAYLWFMDNVRTFDDSDFTRNMVEQKTKDVFKQLDITYYGENNDMVGKLTPEEEFYIRLKIHDYISIYTYNHQIIYYGLEDAFLLNGKCGCGSYSAFAHYFLDCAGVESKTYYACHPDIESGAHYWNLSKIGDEWFESDDGWDAQSSHDYRWFMLSGKSIKTTTTAHDFSVGYDTYHWIPESETTTYIPGDRTLGDINGDDERDEDDVNKLWAYLKAREDIQSMININKKAADINFDGVIDVTDGVLLENIVSGTALDVNNIPKDGMAPGYKVAFLKGTDNNHIQYAYTDREGYITLPDNMFEAPEGKKFKEYNVGKAGERVRIHNPYTVISPVWADINEPDSVSTPDSGSKPDSSSSKPDSSSEPDKKDGILGDVNNDGTIDIEDAVAIIQHINGLTPLKDDEEKRADVSKDDNIDIDDAVMIISYINGNSTF